MTHKFVVGEKVRVARRVDKEEGWANLWFDAGGIDDMVQYVGKPQVFTVGEVNHAGIRFLENDTFGWPHGALDLVQDENEFVEVVEDDDTPRVGPYTIERDLVYRVGVYKFATEKEARDHCVKWLLQDALNSPSEITLQNLIDNASKIIEVLKLVK
jgi:hypothetical protein